MAPINLFDSLQFRDTPDAKVTLSCRWPHGRAASQNHATDLPQGEDNLAHQAVMRLKAAAGVERGAQLHIVKRIPAAAGLGGASSDAAMALVAANEIWQLGWSMAQLAALAAELGSDVPLFIHAEPAIARGRGEQLQFISLPKIHFVVVKPKEGLSTPEVYRGVDLANCGHASVTAPQLAQMLAEGRWQEAQSSMVNDLERPARMQSAAIAATFHRISRQGVTPMMSGSGSSCFAMAQSAQHARILAKRLRNRQCDTFAVETFQNA